MMFLGQKVINLSSTALTASSTFLDPPKHCVLPFELYWVNPNAAIPPANKNGIAALLERGAVFADVERHLAPAEVIRRDAMRAAVVVKIMVKT
jgi:hypothetical protein